MKHYEVRTKGDGEFDFFVENEICEDCGYDPDSDSKDFKKAKRHAECVKGHVVEVNVKKMS